MTTTSSADTTQNRLARETSPYLLQHQNNPVEWYAWGEAALERARAEDKPILLSIGYSACHWCHVMAHESFEDPATARIMNELFVNIKVDREERPDLDSVYMSAVQRMTGHGGWPLTVFLTPQGEPFYGGTYFPPEPRHGMPSFSQLLLAVAEAYRERRDEVERTADQLTRDVEGGTRMQAPPAALDTTVLDRAFHALASRFDARQGGFGGAPKFPQPMTLDFLLRRHARTGSPEALEMVTTTLRAMAAGGMYDQLGGGFHRYSVDAHWLVPHFEKMLYDNALLARVYLHAWQVTGDRGMRRVVEDTLDYVLREMRSPEGGFYSAQDADSEGEEGRFYVWSPVEVDGLLGTEDGALFRRFYDVTEDGNWEGKNILHRDASLEDVARAAGVAPEHLRDVLARGHAELLRARAERVWPGLDDKVLVSWNAMMLRTFAEAGLILQRDDYADVARANARFLLDSLSADKGLLRTWRGGEAKIPAFLEDYALLGNALVALHATSGETEWLRRAGELAETMLERFWEEDEGIFFDAAGDGALPVRPRDPTDNATPSGNSAATELLLQLAVLLGEPRYARIATRVLEGLAELTTRMPAGFGRLLCALDFHLATPREVAIVGPADDPATQKLLAVLAERYLPNTVIARTAGDEKDAGIPLLEGRTQVDGRPAAYVCERYACRAPVTEPEELAAALQG
ncbi:thioredoxin domain-containing protein [soil metagenome]